MAIAVVNPTTGETVEEFTAHTAEEIEIRLQKAQAAH
jgi:acyl-CoA reductase-like NAD-dependent aldehyde dehydrogenase